MKVKINNQVLEVEEKIRVMDLIEGDKYQYQAARVNNRIRELNYKIPVHGVRQGKASAVRGKAGILF